ncbi:hypothetical protein [Streptomyces macrosporus]|uniref:Uncharacterized protein n=1 Tax=Streptomyces macrosporus TaxID=44032 RepID=A0ABN3KR38_9ACTN
MRSGLAATAALCAVAALPGGAAAADGPDGVPAYRTAEDARPVTGGESSAEGPTITPGFYTDEIGPGQRKYYSATLDGASNAWISAVALPEPGSEVDMTDGIKVALRAADGTVCGNSGVDFGDDDAARPIADHARRVIREDGYCQEAGVYHFSVEREGRAGSDPAPWPVEIRFMEEPGLRNPVPAAPPDARTSVPPGPPSGQARRIVGGTGFNDAASMGEGNWKDRLRPGETRFYRVPVDWGQQLFTTVEFGTTGADGAPFVGGAFRVDLYNPARGRVTGRGVGYQADRPAAFTLETRRVDFANRYAGTAEIGGMCFAGWYYIAVHAHEGLGESVEGSVPVVLRTTVEGTPRDAPAYVGDAVEAGFGVDEEDREAAAKGLSAAEAEADGTLRLVGWAGVGTGTALIVGLGLWTLLARRSVRPR